MVLTVHKFELSHVLWYNMFLDLSYTTQMHNGRRGSVCGWGKGWSLDQY